MFTNGMTTLTARRAILKHLWTKATFTLIGYYIFSFNRLIKFEVFIKAYTYIHVYAPWEYHWIRKGIAITVPFTVAIEVYLALLITTLCFASVPDIAQFHYYDLLDSP